MLCFSSLCYDLCRRVILGVGLGATFACAIIFPYIALTWRQRQRQIAAEAEADIVKNTFSQTLGIVCHELRNPVHALTGSLAALLDVHGVAALPEASEEIRLATASVSTMQCVLDDVMEMQRHDTVCRTCTRSAHVSGVSAIALLLCVVPCCGVRHASWLCLEPGRDDDSSIIECVCALKGLVLPRASHFGESALCPWRAHVAGAPRLWQRQSFEHTLLSQ